MPDQYNQESHENELLLSSVRRFMEDEIFPHEDQVDRDGAVPIDLGRQIEQRSKEVGLFAANLPRRACLRFNAVRG